MFARRRASASLLLFSGPTPGFSSTPAMLAPAFRLFHHHLAARGSSGAGCAAEERSATSRSCRRRRSAASEAAKPKAGEEADKVQLAPVLRLQLAPSRSCARRCRTPAEQATSTGSCCCRAGCTSAEAAKERIEADEVELAAVFRQEFALPCGGGARRRRTPASPEKRSAAASSSCSTGCCASEASPREEQASAEEVELTARVVSGVVGDFFFEFFFQIVA